jgi:hypothetical protein
MKRLMYLIFMCEVSIFSLLAQGVQNEKWEKLTIKNPRFTDKKIGKDSKTLEIVGWNLHRAKYFKVFNGKKGVISIPSKPKDTSKSWDNYTKISTNPMITPITVGKYSNIKVLFSYIQKAKGNISLKEKKELMNKFMGQPRLVVSYVDNRGQIIWPNTKKGVFCRLPITETHKWNIMKYTMPVPSNAVGVNIYFDANAEKSLFKLYISEVVIKGELK